MSIKINLNNDDEGIDINAIPTLAAGSCSLRRLTGKAIKYGETSAPKFGLQIETVKSDPWRRTLTGVSLMLMLPWIGSAAWAAIPGGSLDPTTVPKYVTPLYVPPVMPKADSSDPSVDYYK